MQGAGYPVQVGQVPHVHVGSDAVHEVPQVPEVVQQEVVVVAVVRMRAACEPAKRKAPRNMACSLTMWKIILWNSINILLYKSTSTGIHSLFYNWTTTLPNPPLNHTI